MDDSQYVLTEGANARAIKEAKWQPFAYGCLSAVIPGAGHYFRGLTKRGAAWFGAFVIYVIGILVLQPWRTPDGRLPAYLVGAVILFGAGIDGAFAQTEEDLRAPIWSIVAFADDKLVPESSSLETDRISDLLFFIDRDGAYCSALG